MTRLLPFLLFLGLAHADITVPGGHRLEIDFTLPSGADPATNGISLSGTAGATSTGTFDVKAEIFDGTQPLGPTTTIPRLPTRWVLQSNAHRQPHYPLTSVAPIIDGTVNGTLTIENLSTDPDDFFQFNGTVILTSAVFSEFGGFNINGQFNITRLEVVEVGAPPESLKITHFERVANAVNLTWVSETGVSYRVERSVNLNQWLPVATETATSELTARSYAETTPPNGAAFFRVVELP